MSGSDKRILNISGGAGSGKSFLLGRMMSACEDAGAHWVHIEWEDSRHYGYRDVMRRIRDETDPSCFDAFNERLSSYTLHDTRLRIQLDGGNIDNVNVLEGGSVERSGVTLQVGHSVQIGEIKLPGLASDQAASEAEILIELTRAFVGCLRAATADRRTVLFLDGLEKIDRDNIVAVWIREELLERIRDGELPNLMVVLAGREPLNLDPSFFDCARTFRLDPFGPEHIRDYLAKRGVATHDFADTLANWIVSQGQTNPLQVAVSVNAFLTFEQSRAGA